MAAPWLKAEARMESAHRPVLDALMSAASLEKGMRVLDIGIGSGSSTLLAFDEVGPDGHVTGVDVAPPFITRAKERLPEGTTLIVADAESHGFEPGTYDAAISMFGTMFFLETSNGFANIRVAMKPGAYLTLSCWGPPPDNPWLSVAAQETAAVLGPPAEAPDPTAPGPFRFSDPGVAVDALEAAGWSDVSVHSRDLNLTPVGTPAEIAATQLDLGIAASRIKTEEPGAKEVSEIRSRIEARFSAMQGEDGAVRVPARNHIIRARNPV